MRTLLVMRHGKSDWDADNESDHERPLNERGVRSARLMGRFLASRELEPHWIITSTALRARATAELAKEAGGWSAGVVADSALYDTTPDGAVSVAAGAPDVERVLLVGHQPTWSQLVHHLTGTEVDLKTADVALVSVDVDSWDALAFATCDLEDVIRSRELLESDPHAS